MDIELDDDATLALKLLDAAPPEALLMLPPGLDAALCELENLGFAEIKELSGIPLAHITPAGRTHWASTPKEAA